jgi:hypothetical protein
VLFLLNGQGSINGAIWKADLLDQAKALELWHSAPWVPVKLRQRWPVDDHLERHVDDQPQPPTPMWSS